MIPKKSLDSVLDKSITLTITAPNDNAKSISVQCGGGGYRIINNTVHTFYLLLGLNQGKKWRINSNSHQIIPFQSKLASLLVKL